MILGYTLFLLYVNDLPDVICDITTIYADDTTLSSKNDQTSDMWQQFELASELGSDLQDTVDWRKKLISMLGKLNWFYLTGLITLVLLMWKSSGVLRYWGWPFLLNWIGAGTLSLAKTTSKKIAALIRSMKFLSPEVAVSL